MIWEKKSDLGVWAHTTVKGKTTTQWSILKRTDDLFEITLHQISDKIVSFPLPLIGCASAYEAMEAARFIQTGDTDLPPVEETLERQGFNYSFTYNSSAQYSKDIGRGHTCWTVVVRPDGIWCRFDNSVGHSYTIANLTTFDCLGVIDVKDMRKVALQFFLWNI